MQGNFGELVRLDKEKYGAGKSSITNKQLKRTRYVALFYKEGEKVKGWISDKQAYTEEHTEHSKSDMTKFLKDNEYTDFEVR